MMPLIVSYYTPDYFEASLRLRASLNCHHLDHEIIPLPETGNWYRNCAEKARFMLEARLRHPGRPLIWIDCDAVVRKYPALFELLDCDIAACKWTHPSGKRHEEILSGTVYVGAGNGGKRALELWDEEIKKAEERQWDQISLKYAVHRAVEEKLKVKYLPVAYTFIHDTHKAQFPDVEPVIEHFQASRGIRRAKS